MNKNIFVQFLMLLISFNMLAQAPNGPGGVFNRTGTSALRVWHEASDMDGDDIKTDNPANGSAVTSWSDKSGFANHLTQGTAANQPTYNTGGTYPAVNFAFSTTANQSDFMSFAAAANLAPGSAYFVLLPTDIDGTLQDHIIMDDAARSIRLEQFNDTEVMGYTRYGTADYASALGTTYGAYNLISYHKSTANNNIVIRRNANTATLNIASTGNGIPLTRMGKNSNIEGANFNCVEIIAYDALLNTMRVLILDNYLSSKYGNIAIATDVYTMDTGVNGDHDHDVIGVGRAAGTTHTDAAGSVIRIYGGSSINNDGDYLFMGHNNGALVAQKTDLPTGIQGRWSRTWGVTESGDIGTTEISFDLTGQGSVTAADLVLLIDADNDGVFGEVSTTQITGATSLGSNIYEFANVDFATGTRFTLGTTNGSQTPLPIQLVFFTGTLADGVVSLNWKTSTEIDNDYFTVERSTDGETFRALKTIKGAGNSQQVNSYNSIDDSPPAGQIYYRLKQTDFDGTYSYSKTVAIQNEDASRLSFYPHPVKIGNILNFKLQNYGHEVNLLGATITIMDLLGKEIQLAVVEESQGNIAVEVPKELASGVYLMKVHGPRLMHLQLYKVIMTR